MAALANLLKMLDAGQDSALLRFSIGSEYLKLEQAAQAVSHLQRAVELDAGYSAAWKLLGRALALCGQTEEALAAYEQGIGIAQAKGDKQAAKEMEVFARRLQKS
ncbi:MAG: tetratricopeptide repeat protein [Burkholderiales bacterium]